MDTSIIIAGASLALSGIIFFYGVGRDTKGEKNGEVDESKLDQIVKTTETINKKLDDIAKWQQDAIKIHSSHEERIKTLFTRVDSIETRLNDRNLIMEALKKILEKVG